MCVWRERDREGQAYFQELAHTIMEVGKSKLCRNRRHREESMSQLKSEGSLLAEFPHFFPELWVECYYGAKGQVETTTLLLPGKRVDPNSSVFLG